MVDSDVSSLPESASSSMNQGELHSPIGFSIRSLTEADGTDAQSESVSSEESP